jgi:hypothetical protein
VRPLNREDIEAKIKRYTVIDGNGCWLWQRCLSVGGYARVGGGRNLHRLSYEIFVGPIPDGLHIDHLCRVKTCVNPAHLEPVTRHENLLRSFSASGINHRKTHCLRGHDLSDAYICKTTRGRYQRTCKECIKIRAKRRKP